MLLSPSRHSPLSIKLKVFPEKSTDYSHHVVDNGIILKIYFYATEYLHLYLPLVLNKCLKKGECADVETVIKMTKCRIERDTELYKVLDDLRYTIYRIKNKATTKAWDWQQFSFTYHERYGKYPVDKEIIGKSIKADIYHHVKGMGEEFSSNFADRAVEESVNYFNNHRSAILKGKEAIPVYRSDTSFTIRKAQIKGLKKERRDRYSGWFTLLSRKGEKVREQISTRYPFKLRTGGSSSAILDRILEGEYSLCDSKIIYDKKKRLYFLLVTYKFVAQKVVMNPDRVMGVDVGFAVPATIAINDNPYACHFIGDGKEILAFEQRVLGARRALYRSRRYAGGGSRGHGRKALLKPVETMNHKIANFKATKNHEWSKFIVDYAVRHGVSTIQLEDLEKIAEGSPFLRRWTYYDFQQKIAYKAKEYGIEIVKVSPRYTSARCNKCGAIHRSEEKNLWRPKQNQFICLYCHHQDHADRNAAKNLSIRDIDKIIKAEKDKWERYWTTANNNS